MIWSLLSLFGLGMLGKWFFTGIPKEHVEFSLIKTSLLTFAYFLAATAITVFLFPGLARNLFTSVTLPALFFLATVRAARPLLYIYARRHHARTVNIPHLEFFSLRHHEHDATI